MNTTPDFHPSDELLVGFALDELEQDQHAAVDEHLDVCERCRGEVAATCETLSLLALAAPPVEPPADLRARVLDVPRQARHARRRVVMPRLQRVSRPSWLHSHRLVVGGLAACALAAALALPQIAMRDGARSVAFSNGAGALRVDGGTAHLASWSLAAAPPGHTYEVWVMRPGTDARIAGFIGDGREVVIDDVRAGDQIGVTVEKGNGSPAPTTPPVAVADIA